MIYEIIQTHSGADAHFMIKDHENHLLGAIDYHKQVFKISLGDQDFELRRGYSDALTEKHEVKKAPYIIYEHHKDAGALYESTMFDDQLIFDQVLYHGHLYSLFAIHFSSRDMALNIFEGSTQVGQLELERQLTKDEMYTFHLYVQDEDDTLKASIFSIMYYYMRYKAKPHQDHIYKSDEARDYAYSKYDPQFIATLSTK